MRKTSIGLIVFLAVVALTLVMTAPALAANTLYVDNVGNAGGNTPLYTTIQAAINAASDGDTILVYPGTYDPAINALPPGWGGTYPAQGIVVWKANLTIQAVDLDPANTVIVNNLGAWMDWWRIQYLTGGVFTSSAPTLTGGFNPGTSASPNAVMIVKPGCTIDGFTIHAHCYAPGGGYNGSGVLIGGVAPGDPNSLGADGNTVKNCVFSDVWHAVYIWHSSGNAIEDNTIEALGNTGHWAGISIYDGYSADQISLGHLSKNNVIQGNSLADKGISVGAWQPPAPTDNSGTSVVSQK
jgi:parallel beta-helix repeat protein